MEKRREGEGRSGQREIKGFRGRKGVNQAHIPAVAPPLDAENITE